ncbi:hypothetical protein ACUXNS_002878 [Brevibacterium pityocampae]
MSSWNLDMLPGSQPANHIIVRHALAEKIDGAETLMRTLDLEEGSYLVKAKSAADEGVVITGLPTAPVEATKATLARVQVLGASAALVLAGLLGWWWVHRSLRPLAEVSRAAAEVAELPMGSGEVSLAQHRVRDELARPGDEVGEVEHRVVARVATTTERSESRGQVSRRPFNEVHPTVVPSQLAACLDDHRRVEVDGVDRCGAEDIEDQLGAGPGATAKFGHPSARGATTQRDQTPSLEALEQASRW